MPFETLPAKTQRERQATRREAIRDVEAICLRRNASPFLVKAQIMQNDLPCAHCEHSGRPGWQRYCLPEDHYRDCDCRKTTEDGEPMFSCWRCGGTGHQTMSERVCQSCHGTMMEPICVETRLQAAVQLAKYLAPQLRATDHTSSDGSQVPRYEVVIVDATRAASGTSPARLMVREGEHGD